MRTVNHSRATASKLPTAGSPSSSRSAATRLSAQNLFLGLAVLVGVEALRRQLARGVRLATGEGK